MVMIIPMTTPTDACSRVQHSFLAVFVE